MEQVLEILNQYIEIVIMAGCLGIGYIIKHSLDFIPNKYIPLILGIVGILLNIWSSGSLSVEIVVGGLASGLAAVGVFEGVKQITPNKK